MRNLFNSVHRPPVRRNSFPLSFVNDFDTDFGLLTPTLVFETNAGEIWDLSNESFIRTQTAISARNQSSSSSSTSSTHWAPHFLLHQLTKRRDIHQLHN